MHILRFVNYEIGGMITLYSKLPMVLFFFKIFYFRVIGNHTNNGMSLQNESYTPHLKKNQYVVSKT